MSLGEIVNLFSSTNKDLSVAREFCFDSHDLEENCSIYLIYQVLISSRDYALELNFHRWNRLNKNLFWCDFKILIIFVKAFHF